MNLRRVLLVALVVIAAILVAYLSTGRTDGVKRDGPLVARDRGWAAGWDQDSMDAIVGGVVELHDDACLLLSGDVALWPDGTSWDEDTSEVVLSDGRRVHVGDRVFGGGGMTAEAGEPDARSAEWRNSELGTAIGDCLADDASVVVFNEDPGFKITSE